MTHTFERLNASMEETTLENGLRICYFPKPGFSKTFALLATNFGSVDASFTLDGVRYDTPAGVAHFLEHKMFEDADGNALQKFSATGASPNAFTSHTMTAYHFSCTDRFEENLEILLKFVFTPYFTEANVEKEKGIIGQEIGMMADTPDWMAYVGVFEGLYHEHPVRVSISGSTESIAEITPETLSLCHRAFYSPANMVLVVCGSADFDTIVRMARELSPAEAARVAARHYGARRPEAARYEVVRHMAVSRPNFLLGFKDDPLAAGESRLRRSLIGELAARILCGTTSPLYAKLYDARLVTRQFETSYTLLPEGAAALLGGASRDPHAARAMIEGELHRLVREGVDDALFERMKKACYGMNVRTLDRPDDLCVSQAVSVFGGEDFLSFAELFDTITCADVEAALARWARPEGSTQSIILPREDAEKGQGMS